MSIYQIDAGPGTGKTHTVVSAGLLLTKTINTVPRATDEQSLIYKTLTSELPSTSNIAYFVHTNSNKDQISARLPSGSKVYTYHGAGFGQLIKMFGAQKVVKNRLDYFISDITGVTLRRLPYSDMLEWSACKKITNLLKQEWEEPTDEILKYLKLKYPELCLMHIPSDWKERCTKLLRMSSIPNRCVEYADMTWLAAKCLRRPVYDIGIVDESQDLGGATLQLVLRLCRNLICCGDPNQAINAFAGADEAMFQKVVDLSCAVFPLKTTFRLPPNLITKANRLIPNSVLPGPNKIPGEERNIGYSSLARTLSALPARNENDSLHTIVMCRTNAPLITSALILSQKGVGCRMADKELPGKLKAKVKQLGITSIGRLETCIADHLTQMEKRRNPLLLMMAEDFCECLRQLSAGCSSIPQLNHRIDEICTPRPNSPSHLFTTIHKAKGLEADNCFILNPPIEHPLANQNPIGQAQETNVKFVGITRSKANQYWVTQ